MPVQQPIAVWSWRAISIQALAVSTQIAFPCCAFTGLMNSMSAPQAAFVSHPRSP